MSDELLRDDYDGPWKAVLEEYLPEFLALCFPAVHAAIDWGHVPIFLEQELQQIAPEEPSGRQHVDKLVRVRLHNGSDSWILIHVEIQSQYDSDFAERMFRYHTRIFDRYREQVVSLAVLGDDRPRWKPEEFSYTRLGCEVRLKFLTVKLIEFDRTVLDQTITLMSAFVQAHLDALETHGDPRARLARRIDRYRRILVRGYSADHIRALVRFLDWLLRLPPVLAQEAHAALRAAEEELHMDYITSHEEIGIAKGRTEGLAEGRTEGRTEGLAEGLREGIALALEIKFGLPATDLITELEHINDGAVLEALKQRIRIATTIAEVREVLLPPPTN